MARSLDLTKATVVSICPFPINEEKPGLVPNKFHIDAAPEGEVRTLILNDKIYYNERVPLMNITRQISERAAIVAESIVKDRETSQPGYKPDSMPGLFWVVGDYTPDQAKEELADKIAQARKFQINWYQNLIRQTDEDFRRTNSHAVVSDMARNAAKVLKLDKTWNQDLTAIPEEAPTKFCIACFSKIDKRATICPVCRTSQIVDEVKSEPTKPEQKK